MAKNIIADALVYVTQLIFKQNCYPSARERKKPQPSLQSEACRTPTSPYSEQILKQTAGARPDGVRLIQSSPPAARSFGQWLTLYLEERNILLPSVDDMSSLLSQSSSVLNRRAFFPFLSTRLKYPDWSKHTLRRQEGKGVLLQ